MLEVEVDERAERRKEGRAEDAPQGLGARARRGEDSLEDHVGQVEDDIAVAGGRDVRQSREGRRAGERREDAPDHEDVVHVAVITARNEDPAAAGNGAHCGDDGECGGEGAVRIEVAVRDEADEDEEEARARGEGDEELEDVALGEPVADGAAGSGAESAQELAIEASEEGGRTPRRREPILPGSRTTACARGSAVRLIQLRE